MRYILFLSFIGLTSSLFSQQQQRSGNVFLASNMNPAIQVSQSNSGNYRMNDDNNNGNKMEPLDNSDENVNDIQEQSLSNIRQTAGNSGIDLGFSLNLSSSSSSSSGSSSSSRSKNHSFTKKLKKFERNFYGKMGAHKKSKHLVDVCFSWR